jgi:hypothetical protein
MSEPRCEATRILSPASTMMGSFLGEALDDGYKETVRCKADQGHEGDHWSSVCPFPGFADQRVTWGEVGVSDTSRSRTTRFFGRRRGR